MYLFFFSSAGNETQEFISNKPSTAEQSSQLIVKNDALCFMFMKDTSIVVSSTLMTAGTTVTK